MKFRKASAGIWIAVVILILVVGFAVWKSNQNKKEIEKPAPKPNKTLERTPQEEPINNSLSPEDANPLLNPSSNDQDDTPIISDSELISEPSA